MFYINVNVDDYSSDQAITFEAQSGCDISDAQGYVSEVDLNMPKLVLSQLSFSLNIQPNPCVDRASFILENPVDCQSVDILVYDALGHLVAKLENKEQMPAGYHVIDFDARNLPAGMYQFKSTIRSNNEVIFKTGKIIVQR